MLPASAQVSDSQVGALVEALRQAAPQTGTEDDGLYSEWQIKPENIPRWSRSCMGRELTPAEFEASPVTARGILVCVMQDVLQEEYDNSGNNEAIAVRRAASWWMTGDPDLYDSGNTATYTQRVLNFYQQQSGSNPSQLSAETSETASQQPPIYDRYMTAAYSATERRDYDTALLYFRRALDERPNDSYAQQAIQNVEQYRDRTIDTSTDASEDTAQPQSVIPSTPAPPQPVTTPTVSPSPTQTAVATIDSTSANPDQPDWYEVTVNDVGDRFMVDRNSIQINQNSVWYWEYRDFRQPNNAFLEEEIEEPVYGVMIYRSVDCASEIGRERRLVIYGTDRQVLQRTNENDAGRLSQPTPGSSAAAVLNYVCASRQPQ
jgi:hypothetical protein